MRLSGVVFVACTLGACTLDDDSTSDCYDGSDACVAPNDSASNSSGDAQPPAACAGEACRIGELECDGDRPRACGMTARGCIGWTEGTECARIGAACRAGLCMFAQPCLGDVCG